MFKQFNFIHLPHLKLGCFCPVHLDLGVEKRKSITYALLGAVVDPAPAFGGGKVALFLRLLTGAKFGFLPTFQGPREGQLSCCPSPRSALG